MKFTILAAAGATGRELTRQALERGHDVIAIARDFSALDALDSKRLTRAKADARDPAAIAAVVNDGSVVLSGLGQTRDAGVLTLGAAALIAARPQRIIWLGAYGTGTSAQAAGWATRTVLSLMRARLVDKLQADTAVLAAGGTVFHAGPLTNGSLSARRRAVFVDEAPRRLFPAGISRATVAALMLDEAEQARFTGTTAVALGR